MCVGGGWTCIGHRLSAFVFRFFFLVSKFLVRRPTFLRSSSFSGWSEQKESACPSGAQLLPSSGALQTPLAGVASCETLYAS